MWFRKYRSLWVSLLLILMATAIISSHSRNPGRLSPFERILYGVARPVQSAITSGFRGIQSIWEGYVGLLHVQRENLVLQERVRQLEQRITDYQELKALNDRLLRLVNFQKETQLVTIAAQVIGDDATGWFHTLLIDKGRAHGVRRGMPVVGPEGIVGQIIESADRTSKVLLIIDRNSAVDVMIQRSRSRGVMEGTGSRNRCSLKYVTRTADVLEGDRVITSGLGGIYPKGILVGFVETVVDQGYGLFQRVEVTPTVDFDRLEEVMIVLKGEIPHSLDASRREESLGPQ